MGCITIKVDVDPGTLITDAAHEAQILSDSINTAVEFKFNDIMCCALPGGSAAKLTKDFWEVAKSDKHHKFSFSK